MALCLAGAALAQPAAVKPEVQAHIDAARAAGEKLFAFGSCYAAMPEAIRPKRPPLDETRALGGVPGELQKPARVFDNFYYLGIRKVTAWALDTPDGIILFDALDNKAEATSQIEGGLRAMGLDPARIKYIVIAHGHGDHYGGARYLSEKYKARVLLSEADWKFMAENASKNADPPPARDMVITDGQKLTLGGETVTLYVTPGHTPGTVSMLIPVKDRGQPHLAMLWGGTGARDIPAYAQQAERFLGIVTAAGADIALSNHPEVDGALVRTAELAKRGPNDPNPFISGKDGARNYMTVFTECAKARVAAGAS
jgi:metallo-beta-lactamase class B